MNQLNTFRFLHIADVHLDTTFLCRSESVRGHLRQALRTAFERAIDCALEERVDAVLIAGDLFDNDRLSFATENFLTKQVRRLHEAAIPCCYVTGNHDPGSRHSRAANISWPESFHVFRDHTPGFVDIKSTEGETMARVMGAGHVTNREQDNLAALFPPATEGFPYVGLLHTLVSSAGSLDGHDRYAPCVVDDLRRCGYQYWALGHIHLRQRVCDRSNAYYSGNLQGRNPRETGPKGGLLVSLSEGGLPEVSFRSFAPTQWLEIGLEHLEDIRTLADLTRKIRDAFQILSDGSRDTIDWLLRITLSGPCPLADELADQDLRKELEELVGQESNAVDVEIRVHHVTRPVSLTPYRGQPTLLGEVLSLIDRAIENPKLLEEVTPEVLANGVADRQEYLQQLLQDLDREAAIRLLMSSR